MKLISSFEEHLRVLYSYGPPLNLKNITVPLLHLRADSGWLAFIVVTSALYGWIS
jgi:hypothetical protein